MSINYYILLMIITWLLLFFGFFNLFSNNFCGNNAWCANYSCIITIGVSGIVLWRRGFGIVCRVCPH